MYKGNYTFYLKESAARLERQRKAQVNQRKEIQKEKEFINRFRSNIKKAAMVQSRIKALEKMEIIKPEAEEKKIYFRFPPSPPASQKVVELQGMTKAYGDNVVFDGLDFRIDKGDRIAVVGVPGQGLIYPLVYSDHCNTVSLIDTEIQAIKDNIIPVCLGHTLQFDHFLTRGRGWGENENKSSFLLPPA